MRLLVQSVGMEMFNDGLRRTLRLSFQEMEDRSSGETMALLSKVRTDTERFVNASVTILYSSLVGIGFLVWYGVTRLLAPDPGVRDRGPPPGLPHRPPEPEDQDRPAAGRPRDDADGAAPSPSRCATSSS